MKYDHSWLRSGYGIYTRWHRAYSLEESVIKTSSFLNDFITHFPTWLPFYNTSTKKTCSIPLDSVPPPNVLRKIIIAGRDHNLTNEAAIAGGSRIHYFSKWPRTDDEFQRHVNILIDCSATSPKGGAICIDFPPSTEINQDLVGAEPFMASFNMIIKHWSPLFGYIAPYPLAASLGKEINTIGWLTYFSNEFNDIPKLPKWVQTSNTTEGGKLLRLSDDLLDINNPDDLKKFKKIDKILRPYCEEKRLC
jgi:hypothetical protein